jgi:hypothetical protein
LSFETLKRGFAGLRALFAGLDKDAAGGVGLSQLQGAAGSLGLDVDDGLLAQAFATSDVLHTHSLDANEFVVALCVLHLLKVRGVAARVLAI